ncbi:twin-arginine translocation signal domain-containing protein [Aquabacterium sp. A7-Y]|uniref:twin-arginine translocation signal domain-containing protein n=1 Tax=Aquabacterium sp. A7-Y TaxID=1349605 RepID=UPI00223CA870|nr:twin-arginine translocation signal domain-containing protein [Aquabacterium sp. A7-Y]MCW7541841.1 twin-arginine translocation signal domain-containing protein [Aquabacterium sp. A7-Y]
MTQPSRRRFLTFCTAGALASALAACGGGGGDSDSDVGDEEPLVVYHGSTLIVDGVEYPAEPPPSEPYYAASVLVEPEDEEEAAHTLAELGLAVIADYEDEGLWLVQVPTGFEIQWTHALPEQPGIADAFLNGAYYRERAAAAKRVRT